MSNLQIRGLAIPSRIRSLSVHCESSSRACVQSSGTSQKSMASQWNHGSRWNWVEYEKSVLHRSIRFLSSLRIEQRRNSPHSYRADTHIDQSTRRRCSRRKIGWYMNVGSCKARRYVPPKSISFGISELICSTSNGWIRAKQRSRFRRHQNRIFSMVS